jgi:Ni/Co efflux regulator RcnB
MPVQAIVLRTGRKVFKDAAGRFISKAKYDLEQRRGPGGRFLSRAASTRQKGVESYLRAQLGAPPAGKTWAQIAGKYPQRFIDYMDELNQ